MVKKAQMMEERERERERERENQCTNRNKTQKGVVVHANVVIFSHGLSKSATTLPLLGVNGFMYQLVWSEARVVFKMPI